jgi:hypothetical protein
VTEAIGIQLPANRRPISARPRTFRKSTAKITIGTPVGTDRATEGREVTTIYASFDDQFPRGAVERGLMFRVTEHHEHSDLVGPWAERRAVHLVQERLVSDVGSRLQRRNGRFFPERVVGYETKI